MKLLMFSLITLGALLTSNANASSVETETSEEHSWLGFLLTQSASSTTDGTGKEIMIEDPN